ncbi:NERD domain-containing protein [Actinomadura sp. ATCC 31491]|uniref:NERD domain-containing protein n=1 Tax=Actinomadura luzonensis TaxID=2805427 RepID=A0ABT0FJU2_9ACTN|nr:nuclease-related domain-containing protein [Actinomadura luzonensis]MCK2212592.1 NERD domain-containing protein [Actinomadura luzonensis]
MPGGSIYVQPSDKYTGNSAQWWYEKLWREDAQNRRRSRYVKAGVGFVIGVAVALRFEAAAASVLIGVLVAALVAAGDWYLDWRAFHATAVWRGAKHGEAITARLLRRSLARHGYTVLDGRAVKGEASIDHLVIGPAGVWVVDNESWSPDTDINVYAGRLFFGEKYGSKYAQGLVRTAESFGDLLSRETGIPVTISPMLAVHCGLLPKGGVFVAEGLTVLKPRVAAKVIRAVPGRVYTDEQIELLTRTAAKELLKAAA